VHVLDAEADQQLVGPAPRVGETGNEVVRPVPNGCSSLVSSICVPSRPICTANEPPKRRDGTVSVMWS